MAKETLKNVSMQQNNLVKTELVSRYKKWQLKICKWIKVQPSDAYRYMYRVTYKGNARLKVDDVVTNEQGVIFYVLKEENRIAVLSSYQPLLRRPQMVGKLFIQIKPKSVQ